MAVVQDEDARVDVLMVEDEDDQAEAAEMCLEMYGWSVVRARDGRQGLELLPRLRPRLLLLDMVTPRLDGFGVLRALSEGGGDHPPVVVMSSFHDFCRKALGNGAFGKLEKPFTADQLHRAITRALEPDARPEPAPAATEPSAELPGLGPELSAEARDEMERIERLHCLRVMQAKPDEALDELVRAAAELMRTPIALLSIITQDRQWWKAMYGVTGQLAEERGSPRGMSFCTHAVAARSPLVVSDAREHPIFRTNELVERGILNAYAGVPIEIPGIGALGTLCVLDTEARTFSAADLELLGLLASRVAAEIEWRERDRLGQRPLGTLQYLAMMDERHGIYNVGAFCALTGALARRSLLHQEDLALVALGRPAGVPWPATAVEEENGLLVRAMRDEARPGQLIGWLDDRALAALLVASNEVDARAFCARVQRREAALRDQAGLARAPLPAVWVTSFGQLEGASLLQDLRRRLAEEAAPPPAQRWLHLPETSPRA